MSRGEVLETILVGSYASADEPGIHVVELDESCTELRRTRSFAGVTNPSFLALHPNGQYLYAVGETGLAGDGVEGSVHSFRIVRTADGVDLVAGDRRSSGGDHPCHLSFDTEGRWLAASNYGTGSVAVFPINPDGTIGAMASLVRHTGSGPNRDRQMGPHAHSAIFSPDDRFLIVADLGIDQLVIYAFDAETGALARHGHVDTVPGSGPRHQHFHPDRRHLFVVNELDNTIGLYRYDADLGRLEVWQVVSTLPPGHVDGIAADIDLDDSGRYVYVSNRGHNSVCVQRFDASIGIVPVAFGSCGGEWPRHFALSTDQCHLVVANQHSDEVAVVPVGRPGSAPEAPVIRIAVTRPTCVVHLG